MPELIQQTIDEWCRYIGRWSRAKGFDTTWTNMPEKLMLVVTELAEAMEVLRQVREPGNENLPDESDFVGAFAEEIADAVIRLMNIADAVNIDLEYEIAKKMAKNEKRPYKHGKRF